jgi:acyl dehydratase
MNEIIKKPDSQILKGSAEFLISEKAQMGFAELTGDYQSLHVNRQFGRTSRYKDIIVYGLLAASHVSAVKELYVNSFKPRIKFIHLKYVNPIFLNTKTKLIINEVVYEEENNIYKLNFNIRCEGTEQPVTLGVIWLKYKSRVKEISIDKTIKPAPAIISPLKEEGKAFNEFAKGESYCYSFKPTMNSAAYLYDILNESALGVIPDFETWINGFDIPGLTACLMFSPYSGMCIPGKYGASLEQRIDFNKYLDWNKEYMVQGVLTYLSASAKIVQSTMKITALDEPDTLYAHGKMTGIVYDKH